MQAFPSMAMVVLFLSTLIASAGAEGPQRGNPAAGREFALNHCEYCHIVAKNQDIHALVDIGAPSFFDVARRPDSDSERLSVYLATYHPIGRMPYPQLNERQIADLTSYILSLRGGQH